ncbi:hypothetical protein [uncultured Sphingomonas sp.]
MSAPRYRPPHDFGLGGVAIGWEELRSACILHPDAAVPANKD